MGEGRQAHVDPHARRAPPLPRGRGPRPARGHPAAAQRGLTEQAEQLKTGRTGRPPNPPNRPKP
ncbi:hypothetical protein SGPA1_50054 [Streptomyces misionensis JCM 4497]